MKKLILIAMIGILVCLCLPACKKKDDNNQRWRAYMEGLVVKDAKGYYYVIHESKRSYEFVAEPLKGLAPNF